MCTQSRVVTGVLSRQRSVATGRSITLRPRERELFLHARDVLLQGNVLGPFVLKLQGQLGKCKTPTDVTGAAVDTAVTGIVGDGRVVWILFV